MLLILAISALISLLIASFSDLKTREVPDWLSYSTIFFGLGVRALNSLINWSWDSIIFGFLGFGVFFILGHIMYLTGQWGGGDSKLLMGIGAIIGLSPDISKVPVILIFWINTLLAGAVFGMGYAILLAFKHSKKFKKQYIKLRKKYSIFFRIVVIVFFIAVFSSVFFSGITRFILTLISFMSVLMYFLWIFVKATEKSAMIKRIPIEKLTEGDWILKDVVVDGKKICGPKDLGVEKHQIKTLLKLKQKEKIKTIVIKEGIPFVPSFLIAYIATLILGNWLLFL